MPTGSFFSVNPQGTETAGKPHKFPMAPSGSKQNGGWKRVHYVIIIPWKTRTGNATGFSGRDITQKIKRIDGLFMVFLLDY